MSSIKAKRLTMRMQTQPQITIADVRLIFYLLRGSLVAAVAMAVINESSAAIPMMYR
ncbi:hypothetical protein BCR42DRAFT_410134 [Absidia repens]|uniref:Uncharacterized protein n=1 Tax=Absidia repens TaxID=90262 RepID=A0A1X2INN9_9FUNG|nr:hypothetical protein BCR42DRAFT_410134 [Absidia repens]